MKLLVFVAACSASSAPAPTQGSGAWPLVDCATMFSPALIARTCHPNIGEMDVHDDGTVFPATIDEPRHISLCDRRLHVDNRRDHILGVAVRGYETPESLADHIAQRTERSGYNPVTIVDRRGRRDLEVQVGRVQVMLMEAGPGTLLCDDAGLERLAQVIRERLAR